MLTAAAIMNGSLTRDLALLTMAVRLKPVALRFFFPLPGRRLISIIGIQSRVLDSGSAAEREPDREHEERCDFVGHERIECAVANLEIRERVGLLDPNAQAVGERLGESGHAGAATAGVNRAHLIAGARRGREERGRALDADGDFFTAALDHRVEMRGPIIALEQQLGLFGTEAALTLEILAEAARA